MGAAPSAAIPAVVLQNSPGSAGTLNVIYKVQTSSSSSASAPPSASATSWLALTPQTPALTLMNLSAIMLSCLPLTEEDVNSFLTTSQPTASFVGVSWAIGQPVPPSGGSASAAVNGVIYDWAPATAGSKTNFTLFTTVLGLPGPANGNGVQTSANPNSLPPVTPPKPATATSMPPATIAALALGSVALALIIILAIVWGVKNHPAPPKAT